MPVVKKILSSPFRLDSCPGFGTLSRYSFYGEHPFLTIRAWGNRIELIRDGEVEQQTGDPFDMLRMILDTYRVDDDAAASPLQHGGMIGYLGYGLRRWIERVPENARDDLGLPDLWFGCYRDIRTLTHPPDKEVAPDPVTQMLSISPEIRHTSNYTREEYLDAVRRIKDYITAGDIYQVNLSQRFSFPLAESASDLYGRLCSLNPAPFAAYIDCGDFHVVSASPERFLHYDPVSRRVETRPIKGTRPRGRTSEEDRALADALLRSDKDSAEHIMIVDLERNDLGRVCETGSVHVSELRTLERHPTVWHLVSTVAGRLRSDFDRIDLLRATFPGGSITGAPKIRAMEIIDELEPTARGIYTGAIGYLGFDGTMDLNITIRTIVVQGGIAYVYVGGGIVADSDPVEEYHETLDKARALIWALTASER